MVQALAWILSSREERELLDCIKGVRRIVTHCESEKRRWQQACLATTVVPFGHSLGYFIKEAKWFEAKAAEARDLLASVIVLCKNLGIEGWKIKAFAARAA